MFSLLIIASFQMSAQSSQTVTFKDGTVKTIAEAKKGCINTATEGKNAYILDEDKYCDCAVRAMAKRMTYKEVVDLKNKQEPSKYLLTLPGMSDDIQKCVIKSIDLTVKWTPNLKQQAKSSCISDFKSDTTGTFDNVNIEGMCDCYIDEISQKMTYGKYYYANINDPMTNDIILGTLIRCIGNYTK
jgi:hypothetical protein